MKISSKQIRVLALGVLLSSAVAVQAQESFMVAGPLESYFDAAGTLATDYSYAATVTYDSTTLVSESTVIPGALERAFYDFSITQVEYSIYDNLGTLVVAGVEDGVGSSGTVNFASAQNDLSGVGQDITRYEVLDSSDTNYSGASVIFIDSTGLMVADPLVYPQPPLLEQTDSTVVDLVFLDFLTGAGFQARGSIAPIEVSGGEDPVPPSDPFQECAEQARNHGQYVSCVAHVTNMLRANGEMTGNEKGQAQSQAAKFKKN